LHNPGGAFDSDNGTTAAHLTSGYTFLSFGL
jgi:hypothetical protein